MDEYQNTENKNDSNYPLYQGESQVGFEVEKNTSVYPGESQLEFEIKKDPLEFWYKFKNYLYDLERRIEAIPFWKHFVCVFSFVVMMFAFGVPMIISSIYWDQLPIKIPFFYSQDVSSWIVAPKMYLYYVSSGLMMLGLFIYYLSYILYSSDRRLSITINVLLIFVSILYIVAFWQILSLMVV